MSADLAGLTVDNLLDLLADRVAERVAARLQAGAGARDEWLSAQRHV